MDRIKWPDQYKLEYLAIDYCTYDKYLVILSQLPNLRTLIIRNCIFEFSNDPLSLSSASRFHSPLMTLTITDYSITLKNLELIVFPLASLRHLKLISHRKTVDEVFYASYWKEFIQAKLPVLDRFEVFFSYTYFKDHRVTSPTSLIAAFRTPFWLIDKHWFVTCAYVPRLRAIWLHTTPISDMGYENPTTIVLDLGGNRIGDQGVQHLADSLRHNTKVTALDIFDNEIEDNGVQYLAAPLQNNE
ncbi:unnamed protein product, partial [Rotaria magnacalcarata]